MNIDRASHRIMTGILYVNYVFSYIVILLFNQSPLIPLILVSINLIISSVSHYKFYSHVTVDQRGRWVLVFQMILVFALIYYDQSTYEILFLFLLIGDSVFAFSFRFSAIFTTVSLALFFPYNNYILLKTTGVPYTVVMARDIIIGVFLLVIMYVARIQFRENMRYNRVLDERNKAYESLEKYANKIEEMAVDEERSRIAYLLHNSLGHKLVTINLSLQAEKAELIKAQKLNEGDFTSVEKQIQETMTLLRNTIENSEEYWRTLTVDEIIEMLFNNLNNIDVVNVSFSLEETDKIQSKYNALIYNVLLESTTNALKHGMCKAIVIKVLYKDRKIILEVEDDGVGCETINDGFGINHLKKKIEEVNGTYSIKSDQGCTVRVVIPVKE